MKKIKRINNESGLALVVVILVLVVMTILGASAASIVYSDNVFSIHQENTRKAEYLARSAVTIVEEAIDKSIDELAALEAGIDAANTEEEMENALNAYNAMYAHIYSDVLPSGGMAHLAHNVVIPGQGFDSDSNTFKVSVNALGSNKYKLAGETAVEGTKGKAFRILTINDVVVTKASITSAFLFEDALWAYEGINVDANQDFKNIVTSGDVSYGNGIKPKMLLKDGDFDDRTSTGDMPSTLEAFESITGPLASKTGDFFPLVPIVNKKGKVTGYSRGDITPANNGSYQAADWDGDYIVDTTSGDVVLKFNSVNIPSNGVTFEAKGNHDFIVYIASFAAIKNNNLSFNGEGLNAKTKTDIYLFIDSVQGDYTKNNFDGKNLYVYAIDTTINFKNGASFEGAIVAKNIGTKNNGVFTYVGPKNNIVNGSAPSGNEFFSVTKVIYQKANSFWTNK